MRNTRWSGPQPSGDDEQIANARPGFVDLAQTSAAPAEQTEANWAALLPDQEVPLIWEDTRDAREEAGRERQGRC
jgi:hypothetical protein